LELEEGNVSDGSEPENEPENESENEPESDQASNSDSESDSEDETALLMAELQKIRQERQTEEENNHQKIVDHAMVSNPLVKIKDTEDSIGKKSWRKSTPFNKKATIESKKPIEFNNDTLKSDYHRKFLSKHIR
jgi:protein CWC15